MLCKKCKEQKTTGALAVQESQTGLEDLRLSKKNIYSLPVSHTVALDICVLFPERQPSICKNLNQKRWRPWNQALSDSQILGVMSNEGRGLYRGCHFGRETRHGVVDIDINSKYHNAPELAEIRARFAAVGLELGACVSFERKVALSSKPSSVEVLQKPLFSRLSIEPNSSEQNFLFSLTTMKLFKKFEKPIGTSSCCEHRDLFVHPPANKKRMSNSLAPLSVPLLLGPLFA
ncbi:MAG: hypothetical protein WC028_07135 [Candidatus Obscuribacterales bacterium]